MEKIYPKMTQEYLRSILSYDQVTGLFRWIAPRKRVVVGAVAGNFDKDGYRTIGIDQKMYRAGRLAVFYMTGEWPPHEVDHRNLNKADDSWDNLRCGTKSQNMRNVKVRSTSSTGVKCVQRQKGGTYIVRITVEKKLFKIGTFRTIEAAEKAHHEAVLKLHGQFARTK